LLTLLLLPLLLVALLLIAFLLFPLLLFPLLLVALLLIAFLLFPLLLISLLLIAFLLFPLLLISLLLIAFLLFPLLLLLLLTGLPKPFKCRRCPCYVRRDSDQCHGKQEHSSMSCPPSQALNYLEHSVLMRHSCRLGFDGAALVGVSRTLCGKGLEPR
jgi:hypothetical protein